MKIGDKLVRSPCVATSYGDHKMPPLCGTVIWIHPKRRFFRLRFTTAMGSWVECFYFHEIESERTDQHENDSNFEPERRNGKNSHRRFNGPRIRSLAQQARVVR